MAKVLAATTMSLDGFIAGPNDEMDWVFEHAADVPAALVDELIATTGAILGGRRGYEVGRRAERPETSGPFGGRWSGPIFILTHTPPDDETDPAYTFVSGDVRGAVARALAAARFSLFVWLEAGLAGKPYGLQEFANDLIFALVGVMFSLLTPLLYVLAYITQSVIRLLLPRDNAARERRRAGRDRRRGRRRRRA